MTKRIQTLKQEDGFTFVETLLVLTIVMVIITFPIVQTKGVQEDMETALFFESFRSSITLMHNHAILNNQWTVIETKPDNREVHFRVLGVRNHPLEHRLRLPDSVSFRGSTMRFEFHPGSGTQAQLSPCRIQTKDGMVTLSFKMGSGRFAFE